MVNVRAASRSNKIIDIEAIQDDIVVLTGGRLRKIIAVSGINFDLKSAEEQESIILAYQALLNSLKSSLQIFVHSRRLNIDAYIQSLRERKAEEKTPLLKTMIESHAQFLASLTKDNAIMDKNFFVAVSHDPVHVIEQSGGFLQKMFGGKKPQARQAIAREDIQEMNQRTDDVIAGLTRIGLRVALLHNAELEELFYNLYNPDAIDHGASAETINAL